MIVRPEDPNLARLLAAARRLGPLLDHIAFVGGCVTGLLVSDPAAAPVRPTLDVDAIIEITSYAEFAALENRLRALGFRQHHTESTPMCRWFVEELILDLMPTEPAILGFSNRWYRPALENSEKIRIGESEIRLVTAPYFLATKLEAFHGRGNDDYQMSRDLEDIVTVIDGRPEIAEQVSLSAPELRQYLASEFRPLLSNPEFQDALPGHMLPDSASQQRIGLVLARMQNIIVGR